MSKQKKSRQQIRLEERQARKRDIQQKTVTNKSFWKRPIFIGSMVLLLVVGLLYANQSKKASKSLSTHHHLSNSSVTPSLSPNSPLPEGAKVKRRGRWVMAKDLQPGDSIWYKGKWQVLTGVTTIDTLLPEDPKLPIMDYFVDPNHLQQVFAFVPIPLSKYTTKEIEIQRSFNKDNLLLSYATIPDSIYAQYDNLKLPPNQRNIDFDEITPWTWKTFNLEIVNPDSSKVKIQLRRPHWWMSQHKIKGVGSKVNLSLPDQGIGGIATVTFIRPSQVDTRLLKDRNKLGKVFRPLTGWFERTSGNVWDYAFSSREKIGATPEHPFFSEDRQLYIPIGEIRIGERLRTHNGQIVTLVARQKRSKGVEKVYNLEIYRTHTFYAGKDGFLVHNSYISNVPLNKHQNFLKHKGKFEAQGDNIVIKDQALLKEVEALGNKQEEFFKDIIGDSKLLDQVAKYPVSVKGWLALQSTTFKTNTYWVTRVGRWEKAGFKFKYSQKNAQVSVLKNGDEVAEITKDAFIIKMNSFGGDIVCPLDKTTTLIGNYVRNQPKMGTWHLVKSLKLYKRGANKGGLNMLNIVYPEKYTWAKNQEWLDQAVKRGDIIRTISDPTDLNVIWKGGKNTGKWEDMTITGQESHYLVRVLGLVYDKSIPGFRSK